MNNWNNFVELNKKNIFSAIINNNYYNLQNSSRIYISKLKRIRNKIIDAIISKESVGGDVPIYKLNNKAFLWYIHLYELFYIHSNFRYTTNLKIYEDNNQHMPFIIIGNIYHIKIRPRTIHIIGINRTRSRYINNASELLEIIERIEDF